MSGKAVRRGRPKLERPETDNGTPELQAKRASGMTAEMLDACLARGIITHQQHWCGIHLRWLYTLRYGAPGVRAVDPAHLGGIEHKPDDPLWRASREREFIDAMHKLAAHGLDRVMLALCVYNERQDFLYPGSFSKRQALIRDRQYRQVLEGIELLADLWCRKPAKAP